MTQYFNVKVQFRTEDERGKVKKETDKRVMLTYEKKLGKKSGGLVEIGKGKDYIKDLL